MTDLKEKLITAMIYELAAEDMGIYPQTVIDKNGKTKKRTEWEDGWNACNKSFLDKAITIMSWFEKIPTDKKSDIEDFIIAEKLSVSVRDKEVNLWVNCNDLFFWACADGEEFVFNDLEDLKRHSQ